MHRALSLLPRRTQQLRETGNRRKLKTKIYKRGERGGKYAKERVVFSKE
jgi:hypothetical protein